MFSSQAWRAGRYWTTVPRPGPGGLHTTVSVVAARGEKMWRSFGCRLNSIAHHVGYWNSSSAVHLAWQL